jgi:hypothetical protein
VSGEKVPKADEWSLVRKSLLLLIAISLACKPTPSPSTTKKAAAGPNVRATVITIRTTEEPEKRALTQTIAIAGDKARDTSERDVWRLFDTKARTVTFVDEINRTVRTEPLQKLIDERRAENSKTLPPHYPRARLLRPGTTKTILGARAELFVIESGAYKRELWIAEHPAIPSGLFPMMHASEPATLPLAPIMRAVDEVLIAARGFPLIDHAEVPFAKSTLVIDRVVVEVGPKDVPASLFEVPTYSRTATPQLSGSNVYSRSVKPRASWASAQSSSTLPGQ